MSPNRPERADHPIEMISAYVDGRLEAAERERVHDHLGRCTSCQWILADFRALAAAARRESAPPIPAYLLEKIGRRLDAESAARPAPARARFRPPARLQLATAAAVLLAASLWLVMRGRIPGERLAESRSNASPPASESSTDQAQPPQPEAVIPQKSEPAATPPPVRQAAPPPAATTRDQQQAEAFAPSPQAAPPTATGLPSIKKDKAASGQTLADKDESKEEADPSKMARAQAPVPAPAERLDSADAEGDRMPVGAREAAPAAAVGPAAETLGGLAKTTATSRMTLVLVLEDARVSILPSLGVVLISGDYACALPAGGQEEARGLAELRTYATSQRRAARTAAAEAPPAGSDSPEGGEPADLVVPAPPAGGPLSAEAAAEAHRRMWILLREGLLTRAEAQCGPAPKALHPEH